MKKIFILILAMSCLFGVFGCADNSSDLPEVPSQEATEPFDDSELRAKYPNYYVKYDKVMGVEVYIWEIADGEYRCGAMYATNRYKEPDEITPLTKNGATIEEMKIILSSCGFSREDIRLNFLKKYGMAMYEVDNKVSFETLQEIFWGN